MNLYIYRSVYLSFCLSLLCSFRGLFTLTVSLQKFVSICKAKNEICLSIYLYLNRMSPRNLNSIYIAKNDMICLSIYLYSGLKTAKNKTAKVTKPRMLQNREITKQRILQNREITKPRM